MDERLAALDHRVAAAADAWLADPRDIGVYGRLVAAIEARRAYLNPPLDQDPGEVESVAVPPAAEQEDEVLDELADTERTNPTHRAGVARGPGGGVGPAPRAVVTDAGLGGWR